MKAGFHLTLAIETDAGAVYGCPDIRGLIESADNKVGRKLGVISEVFEKTLARDFWLNIFLEHLQTSSD